MIEFEVDMEYCQDDLDYVILHDEMGEMEDMKFVPHRTCRIKLMPWSGWHCSAFGELGGLNWACRLPHLHSLLLDPFIQVI